MNIDLTLIITVALGVVLAQVVTHIYHVGLHYLFGGATRSGSRHKDDGARPAPHSTGEKMSGSNYDQGQT
jgi:hypothetical protein